MIRARRARIVATLGPASRTSETIQALALAGADVFRLNFSHGSHEDHANVYKAVREAEAVIGRPLGILADLQGPKLRLGKFADGYIDILGADLMLWQAAWRLDEGLEAEKELAGAKLWAADAGHRIAHTTVHVHGGVGIDMDGEAHRYFTVGKLGEFLLGGTTDQARKIGALLAAEPV